MLLLALVLGQHERRADDVRHRVELDEIFGEIFRRKFHREATPVGSNTKANLREVQGSVLVVCVGSQSIFDG